MIPQFRMGVVASEIQHPGSGTDPHFPDVVLLLHGQGVNNGTVFTDSSSYARAATLVGGAKTSTAQSKFGTSSILFNGTNSYLSFAHSTELNLGDTWTAESWVYMNSLPGVSGFITKRQPSADVGWNMYGNSSALAMYDSTRGTAGTTGGVSLVTHAWQHVVWQSNGGILSMYIEGTREANGSYGSLTDNPYALFVGSGRNDEYWVDAYMEEVRITRVARYSGGTIAVPTGPFPDA